MASRLQDVLLRGTAAARPLATAVAPGTLYYSTDTATTAQSDGTTWNTYTDSATSGPPALHAPTHSSGGTDPVTVTNLAGYPGGTTTYLRADGTFGTPAGTGTGTVTHTAGALALGQLVVGNASADVKVVAATDGQIPIGKTSDGSVTLAAITAGTGITVTNAAGAVTIAATTATRTGAIQLVIDGGGSVLTTGVKADLYIPMACTITASTLIADQTGSVVLDLLKSAAFGTVPTVSIVASAPPTLSSAASGQDATLTGWTTSVAAGSRLRYSVTSVTTITRVTHTLTVTIP